MRRARLVLAGNSYLAAEARRHARRIEVVPTCVDPDRQPLREHGERDSVTVGWIGSRGPPAPTWRRCCPPSPASTAAACAPGSSSSAPTPPYGRPGSSTAAGPWTASATTWRASTSGSCRCPTASGRAASAATRRCSTSPPGVPAIASPVGVARELVGEDGERGALASAPGEWHAALERLAGDAAERARMGRRGAPARRARLLLPALGAAARGAAPLGRLTALWVPWSSATVTGVAPGEKRAASGPRARDLVRRRARLGSLRLRRGVRGLAARPREAPVFVLGHQKSGTSAVAALLAELTGSSAAIDLFEETRSPVIDRVVRGEMSLERYLRRNRLDFSRQIVKEASLTLPLPAARRALPRRPLRLRRARAARQPEERARPARPARGPEAAAGRATGGAAAGLAPRLRPRLARPAGGQPRRAVGRALEPLRRDLPGVPGRLPPGPLRGLPRRQADDAGGARRRARPRAPQRHLGPPRRPVPARRRPQRAAGALLRRRQPASGSSASAATAPGASGTEWSTLPPNTGVNRSADGVG